MPRISMFDQINNQVDQERLLSVLDGLNKQLKLPCIDSNQQQVFQIMILLSELLDTAIVLDDMLSNHVINSMLGCISKLNALASLNTKSDTDAILKLKSEASFLADKLAACSIDAGRIVKAAYNLGPVSESDLLDSQMQIAIKTHKALSHHQSGDVKTLSPCQPAIIGILHEALQLVIDGKMNTLSGLQPGNPLHACLKAIAKDPQHHQYARTLLYSWLATSGNLAIWNLIQLLLDLATDTSDHTSESTSIGILPELVQPLYPMPLHRAATIVHSLPATIDNLAVLVEALNRIDCNADESTINSIWRLVLDGRQWLTLALENDGIKAGGVYLSWVLWPHDGSTRRLVRDALVANDTDKPASYTHAPCIKALHVWARHLGITRQRLIDS